MWQYPDENDDRPSKQKMPMLWSMCIPFLIHAIHTQILTTRGWAVQQCQVDLEFHRYVRPTEKPQLTDPKVEGFNDVWAHLKDPNPLLTLIIFTPKSWYWWYHVVSNSRKSWCEDRKALRSIDLGHSLSISSSRTSALSSPGFSSRGSTMWFDCQRFCRHSDQTFLCLSPLWEVVDQIWCFRCGTSLGDSGEVGWRGSCHVLWFWPEIHRAPVYDSQVNSTWCQMINQTQHQGRYNWCGSARILLLPGGAIAILSPCVWTLAAGAWMMAGLELAIWSLWLYWSLTSEFCNVSKNLFPSPWIRAHWR